MSSIELSWTAKKRGKGMKQSDGCVMWEDEGEEEGEEERVRTVLHKPANP